MYTFNEVLSIVNSEVEQINWKREPFGLYEPIEYILSLGGKRLRPAITLMACNLYSDEVMKALKPAIGLEIFHNFTLLHDDIMDRADMRRGKPTVHRVWNDNTAILSGDVMQIEAYKWIAEAPENQLKIVLDLFSKTASEICEGQQLDMEFEQRSDVTADQYIEMIRLKTAVLVAAGCRIGAIIGGSDEEDALNLYDFGNYIGLAFQLKDDLLDVYGNEASFGKKIGGDILCNKKTYLLIHTLKTAQGKDNEELMYWLGNNEKADQEDKIKAVTAIFTRLKAREICENAMQHYYDLATESLDKVKVPEARKEQLRKLAQKLMSRDD
ncbi:MAG: polyprenyl synthetase family protein [Paludibacteraceae bacterium]|nr:polyprenyl synthetase family protein [Paludibacteraceae bacterium]